MQANTYPTHKEKWRKHYLALLHKDSQLLCEETITLKQQIHNQNCRENVPPNVFQLTVVYKFCGVTCASRSRSVVSEADRRHASL